MQAAVASYVSSSSGTLRQGPTPVRAFAILKRTNADSGVCEINAHLNKILPDPPKFNVVACFEPRSA